MKAEIISVGTELLLGQISNTNAQYLGEKLGELGSDLYFITCVGDNFNRLKETLKIAHERSDIIIITGGLGPTMDDITKEAVCEFLGLSLELHSEVLREIKCFFHSMGREMKHNNRKQALFPPEAKILPNELGTAPGCIIEKKDKIYILLPGPPREMKCMFEKYVYPYLSDKNNEIIVSKILKLFGVGESTAEDLVKDILKQQTNPTIAPLAKESEVTFRITAKSATREKALQLIEQVEEKLRSRLGRYIYGTNNDTLESVLAQTLQEKGITVATAESCTGGLIASKLTEIPGISSVFHKGFVTYSDEAKIQMLGVSKKILEKYTAVSPQAAEAMALGALKAAGADLAVSSTGYAGPSGEQVGVIYVGVTDGVTTRVKKLKLAGDRKRIKTMAAKHALNELRLFLEEN
ncbi:MAG: CinA [Clostridiales bacterium]|jgi:nicotinamide-nucleotide amidase|nr:CinA [Clostridiales bacterium]